MTGDSAFGYIKKEWNEEEKEWMLVVVSGNRHEPTYKKYYFPDWLNEETKELQKLKDENKELKEKADKWDKEHNG